MSHGCRYDPIDRRDEETSMKIVRYRTPDEAPTIGVLLTDGVAPTGYTDMVEFLASGDAALEVAQRAAETSELIADYTLLAPLPNPGKMLFLGRSFRQFRKDLDDSDPVFVYARVASSVIGPGESIRMPGPDEHVLYEGELLIVIGRAGRGIARSDAMDHVFGYTQVNDLTWTDWIHGERSDLPQITMCKNADTFCPMGPYIVTRDAYDPTSVGFTVTVNGEVRTRGSMSDLVWSIPRIVEFLSKDMTLHPGDVIATGTSDAQPIVAGDTVVVEFDGLGELANPVVPGW
jgi:2-keto-4-pentenoate hydratase/2-oxohepta-3-ene-1,7-dioic acid hydratase in catechol pathway